MLIHFLSKSIFLAFIDFQKGHSSILQQSALSNSNPMIHEQATKELVKESWMDDIMNEYNNLAGNR